VINHTILTTDYGRGGETLRNNCSRRKRVEKVMKFNEPGRLSPKKGIKNTWAILD